MDWNAVLKLVGPYLVSMLKSAIDNFGSTTAPTPTSTVPQANDAIKHLQAFLNVALALNPPLNADGWLGPKTEAAIDAGIAKLKSLGIG